MAEEPIFTLGPDDFMSGIRTGDFTSTDNGLFSADRHVASALYRPDSYQGLLRPPNGIFSLSNDGLQDNVVASALDVVGSDSLMYQIGFDGHLYEATTELETDPTFNLKTATAKNSFDLSNEDTVVRDVLFNDDGSNMYMVGQGNDNIYEYSLSSNFDITTATFQDSLNLANEDTSPTGAAFNDDGSKLYISGIQNRNIYEYDLSTNYDVSTGSFNQSLDVSGKEVEPSGVAFNNDGFKFYVVGKSSDSVHSYNLSTAYDISTASFSNSLDVSGSDSGPTGIAFDDTGDTIFVVGDSSSNVFSYNLSTSYDISTATFDFEFNASRRGDNLSQSVAFSNDGLKMFVSGTSSNVVYEYDMKFNTDLREGNLIVPGFTSDGQTTVANGLAVYKPKNGSKYLYYAQNTQIGRWDLTGLYPNGWNDNWKSTDVETTIEKPMYKFQDRVYFGNDSFVGFIGDDGNGAVNFNPKALDLPPNYHITSLTDDGRRLVIAATKQEQSGSPTSHAGSKIFFWDTNSSSWNKAWEMEQSSGVVSIRSVGNIIYVLDNKGLFRTNFSTPPEPVVEFQPDESKSIAPQQFVSDATYEQNSIEGVANHQKMATHQGGVMWLDKSDNISFYGKYSPEKENALDTMFGTYPFSNIISSTESRGFILSGTSYYLTNEYDFSKITINANKATEWIDLQDRHDITSIEVVFGYELSASDELKLSVADSSNIFQTYGTIDYATYGSTKRVRIFGTRPDVDSMKLDFEFVDGQPYVQKVLVYGDKIST